MKVLITAGGTTEKIDNVRSIVNISTGKLGCAIAEAFADKGHDVYYICGKNAAKPNKAGIDILEVLDVQSLQNTITDIFGKHTIDAVIHAMAVSDYRVKSISTAENFPQSLPVMDKIPSNMENILLWMEKTPKIIKLFKEISPASVLVGFKLLYDIPRETLIETACKLMDDNKCDFVLANDGKEITADAHKGFLIGKNRKYRELDTKEEIANAIVEAVT